MLTKAYVFYRNNIPGQPIDENCDVIEKYVHSKTILISCCVLRELKEE